MNKDLFGARATGTLQRIVTNWGPDHAFIPAQLPPDWELPSDSWPLLMEATNQLQLLEGIGRTLPNPAVILRLLKDREAIRSSEIEGTYATPQELLLYELSPRESKSESDPVNQHLEVLNYKRALEHGASSDLPICLRLIRELHGILMSGVRGKDKTPGEFRKVPVAIGSTHRFIPPPHESLLEHLGPLEEYAQLQHSQHHPLVDCFLIHYQFETIHPFQDGNGRVGRLLIGIMIQRAMGLTKPWLHMSEYFENHRDEYFGGLFNISSTGNWTTWIDYCLQGVAEQAKATICRCERLLEIRKEFSERIAKVGGHVRLNLIIDAIFDSPFVRVVDLQRQLGISYPTAAKDVERLVQAEILSELETIYPKTFYSKEVFRVAYESLSG